MPSVNRAIKQLINKFITAHPDKYIAIKHVQAAGPVTQQPTLRYEIRIATIMWTKLTCTSSAEVEAFIEKEVQSCLSH